MSAWDNLLQQHYQKAPEYHPIVQEVNRLCEKANITRRPAVYLQTTPVASKAHPVYDIIFDYMAGLLPGGRDMVFGRKTVDMFGANHRVDEDLSAVIAHELGHFRYRDQEFFGIKRIADASPFLGMAIAVTAMAIYEHHKKKKLKKEDITPEEKLPGEDGYSHEQEAKDRKNPFGWAIIVAKYLAASALGLIAGTFTRKLLHSHMEYRADKFSAQLLGSGKPLIRAFDRIRDATIREFESWRNRSDIPRMSRTEKIFLQFIEWILHPSTEKRVERLHGYNRS